MSDHKHLSISKYQLFQKAKIPKRRKRRRNVDHQGENVQQEIISKTMIHVKVAKVLKVAQKGIKMTKNGMGIN